MATSHGGKSGSWTRLASKQARPIGSEVQSCVGQAEIHAQPATAIAIGTASRARTDNGTGFCPRERPVSDRVKCGCCRSPVVCTCAAHAPAIIRKFARLDSEIGKFTNEICE